MRFLFLLLICFSSVSISAQTWIDSLDNFAREKYRRPQTYNWTWQNASLLHAMEIQYEMMPEEEKDKYLEYVRIAMDKSLLIANGAFPNGVASANGMAFMYRKTGEQKYIDVAYRILNDYNNILRTSNGGVSHIAYAPELWDDTIYMIGVFFLAMYRATDDIEYINELIDQIKKHQEKLKDDETGLWVHGWDGNNVYDIDFCSQINWADPTTRRSQELWGRGNGWVVLTLSELLNNMNPDHPEWDFVANSLIEMIENLPDLQDETTGHWYQLPVRKEEIGNYLESSCTAMFGFGMLTAIKHEIVSGEPYETAIQKAYYGLRDNSVIEVENNEFPYLNSTNVAKETCIGDKDYYFGINTGNGKSYALAVNIIFGRAFEDFYFEDEVTSLNNNENSINSFQLFPNILKPNQDLNSVIFANDEGLTTLEIIDLMGRSIFESELYLSKGKNTYSIKINEMQSGQYFLLLKGNDGNLIASNPFIIQ